MNTTGMRTSETRDADDSTEVVRRYGCGPVQFSGTDAALYDRHLLFDNVVSLDAAGARERYEAFARSIRDAL